MANIGNLAVTLALDAVAFTTGLDKSSGAMKSFGAGIGKTMAVVSAAEATFGGLAAPFAWVMGGIDDLASIGRASREYGISVERLSGLQFAAGRSSGELDAALRHLNVKLNEAASGSKSARDEFARFGLDGKELASAGIGGAVDRIADRMREMGVQGGGAEMAMQLMGREAQGLIPFMEKGAAAIHELESAGGKLGAIVTQEEVDRAIRAQTAMDQIGSTLRGVQRDLAAGLAPTIAVLSNAFLDWVKTLDIKNLIKEGIDWLEAQVPNIIQGVADVVKQVVQVGMAIREAADDAGVLANALAHPGQINVGNVMSAYHDFYQDQTKEALDNIQAGTDKIKDGWAKAIAAAKAPLEHLAAAAPGFRGPTDEMLKDMMTAPVAGLNIFDEYTERLKALKEAFKGATADAMPRFKNAVADITEALDKAANIKLVEGIKEAAGAYDKLGAKLDELAQSGVAGDALAIDAAKALNAVAGKTEAIHHPTVANEGSKEAYEAIMRYQDQGKDKHQDVQQKMLALMQEQKTQQTQLVRQGQEVLDVWKNLRVRGN